MANNDEIGEVARSKRLQKIGDVDVTLVRRDWNTGLRRYELTLMRPRADDEGSEEFRAELSYAEYLTLRDFIGKMG